MSELPGASALIGSREHTAIAQVRHLLPASKDYDIDAIRASRDGAREAGVCGCAELTLDSTGQWATCIRPRGHDGKHRDVSLPASVLDRFRLGGTRPG